MSFQNIVSQEPPTRSRSPAVRRAESPALDQASQRQRLEACVLEMSDKTERAWTSLLGNFSVAKEVVAAEVWSIIEGQARDALESVKRAAGEALTRLSDMEASASRWHLKEQNAAFRLKLEHCRTAASRQLENQKAETEAKHAADLEKRRQALADGGHSALIAAENRLAAAEKLVAQLKLKLSGSEEALSLTQRSLQESDARAERAESEVDALQEGLAAMHEALSDEKMLSLAIPERALQKVGSKLEERVGLVMRAVEKRDQQLGEVCVLAASRRAPCVTHLPASRRHPRVTPLIA